MRSSGLHTLLRYDGRRMRLFNKADAAIVVQLLEDTQADR